MSIGILYESNEWSSYALSNYINDMGVEARLIDMQEDIDEQSILSCDMIVNRVFASAVFRDHQRALEHMPAVIELLSKHGIPMINPAQAHYYEISKERSTRKLAAHGFRVPKVYGVFAPSQIIACAESALEYKYPFIIKPDCGGRTNYTYIVSSYQELCGYMENVPEILLIAEEYINPEYGYITRIEVIGRTCKLALKRSVTENGLSAYHLGSTYEAYHDLPEAIIDAAIRSMAILQIETGSLDIIENKDGFYIIDVNSVSNASQDNTEMFNFDLMKETAAYVVKKYRQLYAKQLQLL